MVAACYGLWLTQLVRQAEIVSRHDQPSQVQALINQAFKDNTPEQRQEIAEQLKREFDQSLRDPVAYFDGN